MITERWYVTARRRRALRKSDDCPRRTAESKRKRDILRCLKRSVTREVHQALPHFDNGIDASTLRTRRTAWSIPMKIVAEHFQASINAITGRDEATTCDPDLTTQDHARLETQTAA